jgi:4-hydroxy-tetrahydrodipicolinate reductase
MGQALAASINQRPDLELVGVWERGQNLDPLVQASDVVIDFSLPEGTESVVEATLRYSKPLVCGVSGLSKHQDALLEGACEQIPVVYDRNMSLGIAVLERSVREAASSLGAEFDIRVSEVHHVHKKDAPSGTALKLGEAAAEARGATGTGGVQFEVERRGEVPGDHEVTMSSAAETLTFGHSVTTRQVFVDGALRAAEWVVNQPAGRYSMQDVLFSHLE